MQVHKDSYFYHYSQCKTTESRRASPWMRRHCLRGHTHKHDEAMLVCRASLVPHHLLVRGARCAGAGAGAAHLGLQLSEVGPAAAEAHASTETGCEGRNVQDVRPRAGEVASCLTPEEACGDCEPEELINTYLSEGRR